MKPTIKQIYQESVTISGFRQRAEAWGYTEKQIEFYIKKIRKNIYGIKDKKEK